MIYKSPLKKIGLLLCAGALLFASCGKKSKKIVFSDTDPTYPITISIYSMAQMQQPPADNKIYKWIADNLHVTFRWDILVGDKDQKIGVMIAGGEYPDLLHVDSTKFYEAEALLPLDDLIDQYAPKLKAHYADAWEKMKEEDGHVYTLPVWGVVSGKDYTNWYGDSALWVQKEVLKDFGYPKITTMDEYFDLLIKYKEKYPTVDDMPTIGFTILSYDWRSFCLINPPNFLAGFPNDGNGTVDPVTHEYKVFLYQDISKRWFKKLNQMNALGLIDRSCFVDNYDQYLSKIASGRVLGFHDQAWQFQSAEYSLTNQGMHNRTYAPLPIVFDESIRPWYRNRRLPNVGQGIGISVKASDPVRIIRFLEAQLDDEVQKVIGFYGFLGEDYQLDDQGVPFRTQLQRDQQEDEVWKLHNQAHLWRNHNPKVEGSYLDGWPTNIAEIFGEREATMKPEDRELWLAYGVENNAELMDKDPPPNPIWFPAWQINTPDGSDAQIAWKRAEEVYRKYLPRIILGRPELFEDLWKEYVSELGKTDLVKYEAFMQQEINKRIVKWSPKD
ncbi:MAG: extracellular solute-binding protein [Spirochaetaceae bacterium]|jgi:putative aldouronate transport system substrate-binding protein|nr:extracellular solute-binding protein [Spirochaetaceae bacterium]